jgi:hypothetical protein
LKAFIILDCDIYEVEGELQESDPRFFVYGPFSATHHWFKTLPETKTEFEKRMKAKIANLEKKLAEGMARQ